MRPVSLCLVIFLAATTARAESISFVSVTTGTGTLNTIEGTTVSYTVTSNAAGTRDDVSPPYTTDNGKFRTDSTIHEFLDNYANANMGTTITFDQAVQARNVVAIFDNIIGGGSNIGEYAAITVSGGTATTASFDVSDTGHSVFGNGSNIGYNAGNGQLGAGDLNGNSIIIGSTSTDTLTSITLYAQQPYTGFAQAVAFAVPEPSSFALCGIAGAFGLAYARRRRRRA
jgi:hypothetical protein